MCRSIFKTIVPDAKMDKILRISRALCMDHVVRLPGFEPGSSTWQADVLNQARLQPLGTSTFIEKPLKNLQRIHELTMKLKNNGLHEDTVTCIGYKLSQLDRETDLHDSQRVKTHIAVIQHFRHKRT
jgi:hypothetical protein